MTVFDYIEDFDDEKLEGPYWLDQMINAVKDYNDEYGTMHDPSTIIARYAAMARREKYPE